MKRRWRPGGTPVAVAMALLALVLTACGQGQAVPRPIVSVAGPGERSTLFGTTVYRDEISFEDALARQDAAYGPIEVARIFYPGDPPLWQGSPADVAARPVVVSFKLPPAEVISGQHDAALKAWFESIPSDRPVWWVYFHEPENDVEDGTFTAEQFRAAFAHVSAISQERPQPLVKSALVLQCRTALGDAGRVLSDYDPGADTYDVVGFDCYNRRIADRIYPDPEAWLAPVVAAAQQLGRPWALAEMGSQLVEGDEGSGRATWLEMVAAYAVAQKAPFVTYFDSGITGLDYRLTDDPSRMAWRGVVSGQS